MLLQKQFGMTSENGNSMRVVPLFETLTDLENAPEKVNTLFSLPGYVGWVKGKQEIMVGYSDSAKDAGRLAACWAQYTSQEKVAAVALKHNVELTFFHGKGGTVGRGGNPSVYRAVLAHPPNTVNGRFRVTEQGKARRGAKRQASNTSASGETHPRSYFRTRHTTSVTNPIVLTHHPNPFHNALRSSQER